MNKLGKRTLLMLVATALIVSLVPAISFAAITTNTEKTDTGSIKIASKAKTASYKVTWNGNGGKIGTKKTVLTTVKKGSKLANLAITPKRNGYTFKGWYTKKSGGNKITKNTKPTKTLTIYAHWSKKTSNRVLNANEKKLVGKWKVSWDGSGIYQFNEDGTYLLIRSIKSISKAFSGYYSVKNEVLTLQYQYCPDYTSYGSNLWSSEWETSKHKLKLIMEDGKQFMILDNGGLSNQFIKD